MLLLCVLQIHRTVAQAQSGQLQEEKERIKLLRLCIPGNVRDCADSSNWEAALLISESGGGSDL